MRWLAFLLLPAIAAAQEIPAEALDRLPPADVVILGEVHDNPAHHANQARAVAAIAPQAIFFEMLTPEQAAAMPAQREDAEALESALGWEGWPDFAMYHPIFTAAPEARIHGGALPRDEVRRAMTEGAASVFGPDAEAYGLTTPLAPEDQSAREADQQTAHCNALPPEMLPGMVEAQRLRDAVMARAVVEAFAATGGPVVLITGTGHARVDQGVPAALAQAAPELSVLSVGQGEGGPQDDAPYDLWLQAPAPVRDDPCAAFR